MQSTIEDLYAGNKNLANYAKIKKLSIASQAGSSCDEAAAGLGSLAALPPRVSRCSGGPSSLDLAHSPLLSGPESILSLPNDGAAAGSVAAGWRATSLRARPRRASAT